MRRETEWVIMNVLVLIFFAEMVNHRIEGQTLQVVLHKYRIHFFTFGLNMNHVF
ncbi:hypothetical protein FM120_15335 [Sphingobacterium faecium PCAi_F2.5]|nr:hypothetical protein FM120_15335 [Sphingobacterium faecium PCAi_F2.5]